MSTLNKTFEEKEMMRENKKKVLELEREMKEEKKQAKLLEKDI